MNEFQEGKKNDDMKIMKENSRKFMCKWCFLQLAMLDYRPERGSTLFIEDFVEVFKVDCLNIMPTPHGSWYFCQNNML